MNRRNIRFWRLEKSHDVVEYSEFVWIGISSSFLIGPYFFDHNGKSETITSKRYFDMLVNYVIPKLKLLSRFNRIIFHQDGAAPHIDKQLRALLEKTCGSEKVISRGFPNEWPAQSPDLTPLDFWLGSFLKERVYTCDSRLNTHEILKERIIKAWRALQSKTCNML